ncbi:hypothetical protein BT93_G0699 [Corymbia citriodora subsp. variegata]|nr:hypothetical protein BT93_G0699 [Corymbia citriodora subsp. variegata]
MGELAREKHIKIIPSVEKVSMKFLQFSCCFLFYFLPVTENDMVYLDLLQFSISEFTDLSFRMKDSFEPVVIEHLRLNGSYWGLTTLGGFGANIGRDPHLLYTFSAVILAIFDKLDVLDINKVLFLCCLLSCDAKTVGFDRC